MWLRITLKFRNGLVNSGIRYSDDEELYRVELRILETVKSRYGLNGRLSLVDITPLSESHPEVMAIIRSGKDIPKLRIAD